MRPIQKTIRLNPAGEHPLEFKDYKEAKPDLVIELGSFCSYCERPATDLHVEHIYAKKNYPHLEKRWDNFLLACKNYNSIKSDKEINNTFMPHTNNLLYFIFIEEGGIIKIKENINESDKEKTKAFVDLIGLDRTPGHKNYSSKDKRWQDRQNVYEVAQRCLDRYKNKEIDIETIIDVAMPRGFFSVWFTLFRNYKEILEALLFGINQKIPFPNTDISSFDVNNQYTLLRRDINQP